MRQACIICLGQFGGTRDPLSNLLKWTNTEKGGNKRGGSSLEQELYSYGCCTCLIPFSPMALLVKGSGTWKKPTGGHFRILSHFLTSSSYLSGSSTPFTVYLTPHPLTPQQVTAFLGLTGRFWNPSQVWISTEENASYPLRLMVVGEYFGWRERCHLSMTCVKKVIGRKCPIGKMSCNYNISLTVFKEILWKPKSKIWWCSWNLQCLLPPLATLWPPIYVNLYSLAYVANDFQTLKNW